MAEDEGTRDEIGDLTTEITQAVKELSTAKVGGDEFELVLSDIEKATVILRQRYAVGDVPKFTRSLGTKHGYTGLFSTSIKNMYVEAQLDDNKTPDWSTYVNFVKYGDDRLSRKLKSYETE